MSGPCKTYLLHEANKLRKEKQEQLDQLRAILRPAIEAARERAKGSKFTFQANDKALLEAGKILGVE